MAALSIASGTTSKSTAKKKGGAAPATKKAADAAIKKYENLKGRIARGEIKAKETAMAGLTVAEVGGTALLASVGRGYLGDSFKPMGVDAALLAGLGITGYGLYQVLQGKPNSHVMAVGMGALAAGLVPMGEQMGANIEAKAPLFQDVFPTLEGPLFGGVRELPQPHMAGAPRQAMVTPNMAGRAGFGR